MTLRIGNGAGFLGDWLDAPRRLAAGGGLDYLTLEYLAELTLSILARQRAKNPHVGYAHDFLEVLSSLTHVLSSDARPKIITNAGGVNVAACAQAAAGSLCDAGLPHLRLGVVAGDDLLPRLAEIEAAGCRLENMETGLPLSELSQPVVAANAYLGARPIVDALSGGAEVVITGRVADASLTLGPCMHQFHWPWDDWHRLAGGTVAGHLIECGAQVTGGYSATWDGEDLADVGYPIVEVDASGDCVITKTPDSGGRVSRQTVAEQLVYEIGDPARYLTPDVIADFTQVELQPDGEDRVAVRGAAGLPAPEHLKVSLAYEDGYTTSGQLLVCGDRAAEKARACAQMIFERVRRAGFELQRAHVELLGTGQAMMTGPSAELDLAKQCEVVLRISAHDPRREALERLSKEIAPLITSGPGGLAGYAAGRSPVRPVLAFWPALVPKQLISPEVEVRTAEQWRDA